MPYVIFNRDTTLIVEGNHRKTHYKTEGAVRAAITRMCKTGKVNKAEYDYAESGFYARNIEKYDMVENIMNPGHFVKESVNTPNYMSVGSEAYFSM